MRRGMRVQKKKRDSPLKDYVFYYENMIIDDNNFENTCTTEAC